MTKLQFWAQRLTLIVILTLASWEARASFGNYNSVLIGDQAAGMGGAFTALTGDPAAGAFYNPATLSRMTGNTLSASINVYHKYDTKFGDDGSLVDAALRINRGSIIPIPSSSGTVHTFRNFAFGLSIVLPDFDSFSGQIRSDSETTTFLSFRDESLWVGGAWALNLNAKDSIGLTMYYTSRTYQRSVTDQTNSGGGSTVLNEEKALSHNALIYQFGYFRALTERMNFGLSVRFPSLPVSGTASYFRSQISTGGGPVTPTRFLDAEAYTRIPARMNVGLSYSIPKDWKVAFDLQWYGREDYVDVPDTAAAERIQHRNVVNLHLGGEYYFKEWLSMRAGIYSNFSSRPDVPDQLTGRVGDHVDMWGFSTNFALHTSPTTTVTLGGYYTGGRGHSYEQFGQSLQKIDKQQSIFSFLVGTSYWF